MESLGKFKLEDLTTKIGSGATPRGGKNSYKESGISLIRSLNIYDLEFDKDGLAFIDQDQADNLSNVEVEVDDVLINITGASVARCCKVPKEILPARVNQHVSILRPKKEKLDPAFLQYLLVSPYYKHKLLTFAQGGATREALTKGGLEDFEIELPPLDKQQKTASILSAFDDLIENNSRRIEILEEMARRIYREWFVHFRYPGHEEDDPSTGSGQRLVDSGTELGQIPEGWEVKSFGDLVEYERDRAKNDDVDKKVSVLGLGDMPKESITLSEWENTNDIGSTKLRFKKDDVLFGKIRPYFHKVGFAQTTGVCSSDIFVWRPKEDKNFVFALLVASSDKFVETATNSSSGTKMPRAKWDVLEKYSVAYPPDKLLEKLNSLVGSSLKQIRTLSFQNKRLKETRDLLLPKLISGKIDVEEMELAI